MQQVRSLLAEAQALSTRLAALNEVAVSMQASLDIDTILHKLTQQARWVLDFQYCSIALCDGLVYQVKVLLGGAPGETWQRPLHAGAIGRSVQNRHALLLHTLSPADEAPDGMQSALIVPLHSGGDIVGTLNFYSRAARQYTQDDLRIASALTVQVAVMLQNVRLFAATTRARDELRTVLESIGDAVLVIDVSGRVRLLNSAMRRMLLLPDDDLTGCRAIWLHRIARFCGQPLISEEALQPLLAVWRAAPAGGAHGMVQLADGRHIEWAYASLVATGTHAGVVLTFRDVSARMELEQLRDDMLHMLVHDLRTPLTGLMLGLDLMTFSQSKPEEHAELLQRTRQSAATLLNQVNTILEVRKLEAGRLELERELTYLPMLVEQALASTLPLAQQVQQTVLQDFAADLPLLWLDVRLFVRVIENIVGNAVKFTPLGGRIVVGAHAEGAGEALKLWVQDNGPGVPEELRAVVFEKYGQAPGKARRRGSGLGLAFCKLVVEAHGGQVGVDEAPGGGSIFWVRVPLNAR
jgi:signal transduction histidine kinase